MEEQLYTSRAGVSLWKLGKEFYVWTEDHWMYGKGGTIPVAVDKSYIGKDGLCSPHEYVVKSPSRAEVG